jgi:hypothetical protein
MDIKKVSDTITEVDSKVRIEIGHVRRRAVATAELLSDAVTANHYAIGKRDAGGKPIELGQPFDYIDWKSAERAYYVYRLEAVNSPSGKARAVSRWALQGVYPDYETALSQSITLL